MDFEWSEAKAVANLKKHGVSFEEATTVFIDPASITISDPLHSAAEDRWVILGLSHIARLLVVVHTERGDRLRVISARPANRQERVLYEEKR